MSREKIIDRVAKLLRLAQSKNAGEAAAAAAAAQRLLSEHRLSEAEIDAGKDPDPIVFHRLFRKRGGDRWKRYLATTCAHANGCRLVEFDRDRSVVAVGTQSDVLLVEVLFTGIVRDLSVAVKGSPDPQSWLLGAAYGVWEALEAAKKAAYAGASSVALVRLNQNDTRIAEFLAGRIRQSKPRRVSVSTAAYEAGRAYGRSMNLASRKKTITAPQEEES